MSNDKYNLKAVFVKVSFYEQQQATLRIREALLLIL